MADLELTSEAEIQALKATKLKAFDGINLFNIKRQISKIAGLIGSNGIFGEYTKHDISHIDAMLESLDWLIPSSTKQIMTPGDWLMTVLSIYFHDLGMLVTNNEFNDRNSITEFIKYKELVNSGKKEWVDFQKKVESLGEEKAENFLYQEFVRKTHAERIKLWIQGKPSLHISGNSAITEEINDLLNKLQTIFRKDLGNICESHHLDDLYDTEKYKLSQPYGQSGKESVNLQYCAILLRATDLLHVTNDRTPSVEYRLINPSDPISQIEWSKQQAVRAVREKKPLNKEGKINHKLLSNVIEIYAYFSSEKGYFGFFGLDAYINYTKEQLRLCNKWAEESNKVIENKYLFPWNDIDDTNVETEGFERKLFEFSLDREKILNLLVGHTLYNDISVVIRELIQNSIDAVRLQYELDKEKDTSKAQIGSVEIFWDEDLRELTVKDNGTGMTQSIIENNLLKVGSSYYQEENVRKQFPNFSSISRFGIGILTIFLISDEVDILTCHESDELAREVSIRQVFGKYLIKYINKNTIDSGITPHGTIVKLKIRHSAVITDILSSLQKWILFPACKVYFKNSQEDNITIGYDSPKKYLESRLSKLGYTLGEKSVKVEEKVIGGLTLAYAVRWHNYFNEWSFLKLNNRSSSTSERANVSLVGICIEGIRIESTTPGFSNNELVIIGNTIGNSSPKTNVARSLIESDINKDILIKNVYNIITGHIEEEIDKLFTKRAFSLTWAVEEANYLLKDLDLSNAVNKDFLLNSILDVSSILIEKSGTRTKISPNSLKQEPSIWTIDSVFFRHAESLLREIPTSNASLSNLLQSLGTKLDNEGIILCGFNPHNIGHKEALYKKQVDTIIINEEQRRIDFRWVESDDNLWINYNENFINILKDRDIIRYNKTALLEYNKDTFLEEKMYIAEMLESNLGRINVGRLLGNTRVFLQAKPIKITGRENIVAVESFGNIFIMSSWPLCEYFIEIFNEYDNNKSDENVYKFIFMNGIVDHILRRSYGKGNKAISKMFDAEQRKALELMQIIFNSNKLPPISELIDTDRIISDISTKHWEIFNPSAWTRKNDENKN